MSSRHGGWQDLSAGNLLRVFWEDEKGSYLCRLVKDDNEQLFVRSADNRFQGLVPFSASEDSWIKMRQTCTKDNLLIPCSNCAGSKQVRRCMYRSGQYSPPGWMPLASVDHRELQYSDSDSSESDSDPEDVSKSGRHLRRPQRSRKLDLVFATH